VGGRAAAGGLRGKGDFAVSSAIRTTIIVLLAVTCVQNGALGQTVHPLKDGTLADGGTYGAFDGIADDWDWTFNQSGYEGSITLTTEAPAPLEHRLVWEYDLSSITLEPPVAAALRFSIRGAPIWPFPDVNVSIYSYPADLQETPDDYHSGPSVLQGAVTIVAYQDPTEYVLDVGAVVSDVLLSGVDSVAFRFQVDPNTPNDRNQAFIDALDSNPSTKPFLVIEEAPVIPGDLDGDGDVDLSDLGELLGAYGQCAGDPLYNAAADFDDSGCVDLPDLAVLLGNYGEGT
jgi:hypothetical protein